MFEELAQAASTSSVRGLVSQAVSEMHLGRLEEAQAALEEALAKEPAYPEAIANLLVLTAVAGKDTAELAEYVPPFPPFLGVRSGHRIDSLLTRLSPGVGSSRRRSPSMRSWLIWRRRARCLTWLRPSTAPRLLLKPRGCFSFSFLFFWFFLLVLLLDISAEFFFCLTYYFSLSRRQAKPSKVSCSLVFLIIAYHNPLFFSLL